MAVLVSSTAPRSGTSRDHRRRLQFSLRAFLLALTAMCVAFGWWVDRTWRQHEAVATILKAGGSVVYLWDRRAPGEIGPTAVEVTGNDPHFWLDFFKSPDGVLFAVYQPKANDDLCRSVATLHALTTVSFTNCPITDVGLSRLAGLKHLDWLDLDGTKITDDGLVHLKTLCQLDVVALKNTAITDQGLEHLTGLKNLSVLLLRGSKVTHAGASRFKSAVPACHVFLTNVEWHPPS